MTELAAVSRVYGHPTSFGTVTLLASYGPDGMLDGLEILHADPRVLIGGKFLRDVHRGVSCARTPRAAVSWPGLGGTFRISADNRTVIWVLTEFEPEIERGYRLRDAYTAEWPD